MRINLAKDKEILGYVYKYYEEEYLKITNNWKKLAHDVLKIEKAKGRIREIERGVGMKLKNKKVLEIGSGFGVFVAVANIYGADCWGVEPDKRAIKGSHLVLKKLNVPRRKIICSYGEKLPFGDNSFDLVCSFMVLEHAKNPKALVEEAIRVMKPGGRLYFIAPNHKSFWEGHYGLFWIPVMPKSIARFYVRLFRRSVQMLDEIKYITPAKMKNIFSELRNVELRSLGEELWEERMRTLNYQTWGQTEKLFSLVKVLKSLKLTNLAIWLGLKFEWYYPLVIVAQKK